jgi:hypothetical protein
MATMTNLRSNVQGWGSDLDPHNRPGVPREKNDESVTDIRGEDEYELIPRQTPRVEILVSTEHKKLTPVFGTSCPPRGLSGMLRRLAFKYSEGKKAHWMILLFADRVDVVESAVYNLVNFRSHSPIREYGIASEFRKGRFAQRFGRNRGDTKRLGQQAVLVLSLIGIGALFLRSQRRSL